MGVFKKAKEKYEKFSKYRESIRNDNVQKAKVKALREKIYDDMEVERLRREVEKEKLKAQLRRERSQHQPKPQPSNFGGGSLFGGGFGESKSTGSMFGGSMDMGFGNMFGSPKPTTNSPKKHRKKRKSKTKIVYRYRTKRRRR